MSNKFITKVRPVNMHLDENHFEQDVTSGQLDLARTGEFFREARNLSGSDDFASELSVANSVSTLSLYGLDGSGLAPGHTLYGSKNLWHAILKLDADFDATDADVDASIDAIQVDISEIRADRAARDIEVDNSLDNLDARLDDIENGVTPVMQLRQTFATASDMNTAFSAMANAPAIGWCYYVQDANDLYVRVDDLVGVDITPTIAGAQRGFIRIDNYIDEQAARDALKTELDASVDALQARASVNEDLETARKVETDNSIDALQLRASTNEDFIAEELFLAQPRKVGGQVTTAIDPTIYDDTDPASPGSVNDLVFQGSLQGIGGSYLNPTTGTPEYASLSDLLTKLTGSDSEVFSVKAGLKLDGLSINIARDWSNDGVPYVLDATDIAGKTHEDLFNVASSSSPTPGPGANADAIFYKDASSSIEGIIFAGKLFPGQVIGIEY